MKAVLLLVAVMAVSCHGLGFPNFGLGCVGFNGLNLERFDQTPGQYAANGVIPYCDVSNPFQYNTRHHRKGYSPQFHASDDWVILRPTFSERLQEFANTNDEFALRAIVVSIGPTVGPHFRDVVNVGNEVAVDFGGKCFGLKTALNFNGNPAATNVFLGLYGSTVFACPAARILGKYQDTFENSLSEESVAQSLILDRPFVFYGL